MDKLPNELGPQSTPSGADPSDTGELNIADIINTEVEFDLFKARALAGRTVASDKRSVNQDALFLDAENQSFGVFDGVGDRASSEQASQIAVDTIRGRLAFVSSTLSHDSWGIALKGALIEAHKAIFAFDPNVATTATVAKLFVDKDDGQPHLTIANAGDSRAYLLRNGILEFLTIDHTPSNSLLSESEAKTKQKTMSEATDLSELTEQEQGFFKHRYVITNCLGDKDTPTITISDVKVQRGDLILLTTDGIHDNLTTTEIEAIAADSLEDPDEIINKLLEAAKERSRDIEHFRKKDDDMTAAAILI